jgi:hypothetical protein
MHGERGTAFPARLAHDSRGREPVKGTPRYARCARAPLTEPLPLPLQIVPGRKIAREEAGRLLNGTDGQVLFMTKRCHENL